jgi:hypothetical protein
MHPDGCMDHSITCPTCDSAIEPEVAPGAKLLNAAMWVCAIVLAVAASIPLLGLAVLPLWFLALWGLGASAARMSTVACPVCHSEVARPTVEPSPVAHGPLVPHHA